MEDILCGKADCRLVKIRGTLREIFRDEIDRNYTYLVLTADGKLLYASTATALLDFQKATIGSEIEITGICDPFPIGGRRHLGRLIRIAGRNAVKVSKSPGDETFSAPMLDDTPVMGPMEIQSLGLRRAKGTVIAAWHPRNLLIETERKNLIYATVANQKLPASGTGIEVEGVDENLTTLPIEGFRKMIEKAVSIYPNFKAVATTLRSVKSATVNDWSAICWYKGELHRSVERPGLEIYDRVGGGDSFASGLIYGLMTFDDAAKAVNYGAAHGALAMTTPGDTSMATKADVEKLAGGGGARVDR